MKAKATESTIKPKVLKAEEIKSSISSPFSSNDIRSQNILMLRNNTDQTTKTETPTKPKLVINAEDLVFQKQPKYFMDDEEEGQRLKDKVDTTKFVEQYLQPHIKPNSKVLDIGCGPGHITGKVAELYPSINCTGLDLSNKRINDAVQTFKNTPNVNFVNADSYNLPFVDSQYSLIYCRFLLEYLAKPEVAIKEMARVCEPGGKVVLQDLDGQLSWMYPEDHALKTKIDFILDHLNKSTGFDPFIGKKLYKYAINAGLKDVQVQAESYNLIAGTIDEKNYKLWEMKLDHAMNSIQKVIGP